ncbi:MAG: sensor histidine kinase [Pseudomonadota bacterium]
MYQMESGERSTEYLRLFDLTYDMEYMISSMNDYFRATLNGTVEILSATIEWRSWKLKLVLWLSVFFIFTLTMVFIIMSNRALNTTARQLKFLSNRLMDAEDIERKRWAQELHDEIGQALTGIKYGVDNAVSLFERARFDDGIAALNNLIHVIQNAIEDARRISVSLWPAILDQLGIVATISWYCREYQRIYLAISLRQHIRVKEGQISDALKITIYRVLQEALTNVAKHSSAGHVFVKLKKSAGVLRLTITDDGSGFSLPDVERADMTAQHGLGLMSMRERVELSGGEFEIDTAPGRGTTISASWRA